MCRRRSLLLLDENAKAWRGTRHNVVDLLYDGNMELPSCETNNGQGKGQNIPHTLALQSQ